MRSLPMRYARARMTPTDDALDLQQLLAAFGEIDDDVREMMKDLKRHPWKFLWKE